MRRWEHGTSGRSALAGLAVCGLSAAALVLPGAGVAAAALPTGCVGSAGTVTCSYGLTGGEQVFTAPAGVGGVQVVAVGGAGGAADAGSVFGRGARVTADLTVTAGRLLYVEVGGAARGGDTCGDRGVQCVGGFNGGGNSVYGGGGGGASDVRTVARAQSGSPASRLLVAAGGGGAGQSESCVGQMGGTGGNADSAGGAAPGCKGLPGVGGGGAGSVFGGGGAGGTGGLGDGSPGTLGQGGDGGSAPFLLGGAGGGGLFGGGGGSLQNIDTTGDCGCTTGSGGGGGGASLVPTGGERVPTSDPVGVTISYSVEVADTTGPVVVPTVTGTLGGGGWYTSDVGVSWTVTDPESPVTASTDCGAATVTGDSAGTAFTCTATSAGGTATSTVTVKRDATAPVLSVTGGPADGSSPVFGSVPAAPSCTATDGGSGPPAPACTVSGYATTVGPHTVTFRAVDVAGNAATATRSYTVAPWRSAGFTAPVDMGGVVNTVKGGSTVPLKFEVFAGDVELTDPGAIGAVFTARASACSGGTSAEVEFVTTGNTELRYSGGQFVQNWKTPKQPGACYTVSVTTADGSALTALFRLT